ncbi:unnamed protein product [marine sediment metagenome]|uniref:Polymerase nucleotidyl transferase domain-containing protein n=1 Tax=marine sediment metagenome TaxID=412755 RepID=X0U4J3_9ZZZZ
MPDDKPTIFDNDTIQKAAELLLEAAPGATVILFGSYVRGNPTPDSDLDFLVIEPDVTSHVNEMVRLRDVLRPLRVAADVLVSSEQEFRYWSETPGTVHYDAAKEGRVFRAVA